MNYRQTIPLVYSGQEIPNKKRLKFFVKDPIVWSGYEMAPFYETMLKLRKSTPALDTDAEYIRINTKKDESLLVYLRKKNNRKVLTILNLTNERVLLNSKDLSIEGVVKNVFTKEELKFPVEKVMTIDPWGFEVYTDR